MNAYLKKGLIFGGIVVLVALSYGVYRDAKLKKLNINSDRKLEINGSTITGYNDGILSFRIKVKYIWAGRSKYLFEADNIKEGVVYNPDGSPIIDALTAGRINVNTRDKTLTAYNSVSTRFLKQETDEAGQKSFINVKATELRYYNQVEKSFLYGQMSLIQGGSKIFPIESVEIDHKINQVYVLHGYRLFSGRTYVTGNIMTINLDEEWAYLSGGVEAIRRAQKNKDLSSDDRETELESKQTELWCDSLQYNTKGDADVITLEGNIVIFQDDKEIRAEHGYYNKRDDYFEVEGKVDIITKSLLWLLRSDKKEFKNPDVKVAVQKNTQIKADKIQFYSKEKRVEMSGNVWISQDDKTLKCDSLTYDDETGFLTLKGHVDIVLSGKNESKMKTEYLKINIKKEALNAENGVETEFTISKKR